MRANTSAGGSWSPLFHNFTSYDYWSRNPYWNEPFSVCSPEHSPIVTTPVTAKGGLAVTVFGAADAFGLESVARANVDIQVVDRGLATFAIGSASFTAAAQGNSAYATTYGGVAIAGADLSIVSTNTASAIRSNAMAESTSLSFAAVNLKFDLDYRVEVEKAAYHELDGLKHATLEGNAAIFQIDAAAAGENSFVDIQADAMVVEDTLSTVTVSATAGVSGEVVYTQIVGSSRSDKINTGPGDTLVLAGGGDDRVLAGAGDDWIFGGRGRDTVSAGAGSDTLVGQDGADGLYGEDGADWIFGGEDDDAISGGGGDDLLLGGRDDDTVSGGAGNDILCGGEGRDCLDGGAGDDIFRLGAKSGDDNDIYNGGSGSDLFLVLAKFDRDMIQNFSIAQGDRLAIPDLEEVVELGRCAFTMERSSRDADDLVITFDIFDGRSELTLDEFFALNTGFGGLPRRGIFSEAQAETLLARISLDVDSSQHIQEAQQLLQLGDLLSLLG